VLLGIEGRHPLLFNLLRAGSGGERLRTRLQMANRACGIDVVGWPNGAAAAAAPAIMTDAGKKLETPSRRA
jgi:hypothetical protein